MRAIFIGASFHSVNDEPTTEIAKWESYNETSFLSWLTTKTLNRRLIRNSDLCTADILECYNKEPSTS